MPKNKIFLYLLIVFLIITIFSAQFFKIKHAEKQQQLIQLIENKSNQIDVWLLKNKQLLETLSKDLEKIIYDKENHLKLMNKTNKAMGTNSIFSGFKNGKYFDTQGYWLNNFDPRVRPWYNETLENKQTTISGPMYYNDISGQKIAWWSIGSIFFKDNKPFGVIAIEIMPDMITNQLKEIQLSNLENLFLFNKKTGIIVSSIDRDLELKYIQDIFSEEIFIKLTKANKKIKFSTHHESKMAYISDLKEAQWVLCAIKAY